MIHEFILVVVLIAMAIAGLAIKMFLIPGKSFTKTCSSKFDYQPGKQKKCACSSDLPEDCINSQERFHVN